MSIIWNEGNRFQLNGIQFQYVQTLKDLFTLKEEDGLVLGKWRRVIDTYLDTLADMKTPNIFELGIFRGGSAAFFNELLEPQKLVAIDYMQKPTPGFKAYLENGPNAQRIHPYFSVDQADTKALNNIYTKEFGTEPLDLVIDDASHFLNETRASFNFLFPKLRSGCFYVIEDWSWAHLDDPDGIYRKNFDGQPPMSNLIIEILLASARRPDLIPEARLFPSCAFIRRGEEPLAEGFDISRECFHRGRQMGGRDLFAPQRQP